MQIIDIAVTGGIMVVVLGITEWAIRRFGK